MGKKKVKPNGFSEFMHEFISEERKKKRFHPKEEWAAIVKPHWDRLSAEEQNEYKERAKGKSSKVVHVAPKYTCHGIPLEQIERQQKELAEKRAYMERTINQWVLYGLEEGLTRKPMYFIMANYFYKTHEQLYSPAELAIGKFTIEDGLMKHHHTFVNPGSVQLGYAFDAKDRSERIHRLPPPPEAMGERNFNRIFEQILDVLGIGFNDKRPQSDKNRLMVLTRTENMEMMTSILDQLPQDVSWRDYFDLFELEPFFHKLKNEIDYDPQDPQILPISVTNYYIEQDRFDLTPHIACSFHEEEDATKHCALSHIRRWFYTICDHVAVKLGVKLLPIKHIPENLVQIPSQPVDSVWSDGDDNENCSNSNNFVKKENRDTRAYQSTSVGYHKFEESDSDA